MMLVVQVAVRRPLGGTSNTRVSSGDSLLPIPSDTANGVGGWFCVCLSLEARLPRAGRAPGGNSHPFAGGAARRALSRLTARTRTMVGRQDQFEFYWSGW